MLFDFSKSVAETDKEFYDSYNDMVDIIKDMTKKTKSKTKFDIDKTIDILKNSISAFAYIAQERQLSKDVVFSFIDGLVVGLHVLMGVNEDTFYDKKILGMVNALLTKIFMGIDDLEFFDRDNKA